MEHYSTYEFEIKCHDIPGFGKHENQWVKGYFYVIYSHDKAVDEAMTYYDTEQEARFAVIGHIDALEKYGVYEHD